MSGAPHEDLVESYAVPVAQSQDSCKSLSDQAFPSAPLTVLGVPLATHLSLSVENVAIDCLQMKTVEPTQVA